MASRASAATTPKILLIVLDGFGDGKNYPFNAIKNAKMPFYRGIAAKFPRAQLLTCGEAVGLPPGVMGNSEVGHTNMGAGRVVYQELTRINRDIRNGDFRRNEEITATVEAAARSGGRVHLLGLLSDAGVHAHIDHLKALVAAASEKAPVTIHVFTDGRDTPPTSSLKYVRELEEFLKAHPHAVVGSLSGRYYAMDRDHRWDRVELAHRALTGAATAHPLKTGNGIDAAIEALRDSHAKNVTDEFVVPSRFEPEAGRGFIADGDAVVFANFRADRARELTRALTEDGFAGFKRDKFPRLSRFLCFTRYDKTLALPVAFPPQNPGKIFPELLEQNGLRQFRIAETEKYAHVTFFFNGGREQVFTGEERALIPSPRDVATYDLKPEMSAPEVTEKLSLRLKEARDHFVLVNYANPDMVGHTGNYEAAVKAMETVDRCLNIAVTTALSAGYEVIITADHGNIEEMRDEHDQPHTQHTLNPVPVHYLSKRFKYALGDGVLADLAPTMLEIMGLPKPAEMTGTSLLKGAR